MLKACAGCGVELEICEFPCSTHCRTFVKYPMKDCRSCQARHKRQVRALEKIFPRRPEGSPCDLCGRAEKRLFLDHDHAKTGREAYRGYLCIRCNTAACSYSVRELEQTITYLRRNESTQVVVEQNSLTPCACGTQAELASLTSETDENPLLGDSDDFSSP